MENFSVSKFGHQTVGNRFTGDRHSRAAVPDDGEVLMVGMEGSLLSTAAASVDLQ